MSQLTSTRNNKKRTSLYLPAYMLLVGGIGYVVLGWLSVGRWQEGISVSLLWEAGFFLGLALL